MRYGEEVEFSKWWFLVLGLIIVSALLLYSFYPVFMQMRTNAMQNSYEYIHTTQETLNGYINQYYRTDTTDGQKKAINAEICSEVDTIPSNQVPDLVQNFIVNHPCGVN